MKCYCSVVISRKHVCELFHKHAGYEGAPQQPFLLLRVHVVTTIREKGKNSKVASFHGKKQPKPKDSPIPLEASSERVKLESPKASDPPNKAKKGHLPQRVRLPRRAKPADKPTSTGRNPLSSIPWERLKSALTAIPSIFKRKNPKLANQAKKENGKQRHRSDNPFLNKLFSIYFKLTITFIVPVLLMIILGVVSFLHASDAIIGNYQDSINQALNMTKEYFNFAFTSLEAQINTYLFDVEVGEHFKNVYVLPEEHAETLAAYKAESTQLEEKLKTLQEGTLEYLQTQVAYIEAKQRFDAATRLDTETAAKQSDLYKQINADMTTYAASSPFIENIFLLNDISSPLTTVTTIRTVAGTDREDTSQNETDYYTPFLETEFGKKVMAEKTKFHWNGAQPELDMSYEINSQDYCIRVAHAFTDTATGYAIIDVSTEAILEILNNLQIGDGSLLGIVTPDGQEIVTTSSNAETVEDVAEQEGNSANDSTNGEEDGGTDGGAVDEEDQADEADGKLVSTNSSETIFTHCDFYTRALSSEEVGGLENVTYEGEQYLFMYSKIGGTGNLLCALIPRTLLTDQVSGIKTLTIWLVILASIIAVLIGFFISTGISKTIKESVKHLVTISKGDLTVEYHTDRRDEFAQLADGMTEMVVNFRGLIKKLSNVYHMFLEALHMVSDTSGTFNHTSKDIQTAVHEIEIGITQQSDDATSCLEQMDSLFNRIGVVNDKTTEIGSIATSTSTAIMESLSTMDDLKEKTNSTTEITGTVIHSIVELEKKSRNIRQIVNVINDIAEETNLLSLNASIEAAKAGSAGKGFAVVADQIRKLADQSLTASAKINGIIEEIIGTTKSAVKTAEQAETVINLQVSAVDNTSESFNAMSKYVEELIENLTLIQSSSKSMEESGVSTLRSMENISSVLQQTSAATTSVAEIVDKQTDALHDLDQAANLLTERARELDVAIKQFKTR